MLFFLIIADSEIIGLVVIQDTLEQRQDIIDLRDYIHSTYHYDYVGTNCIAAINTKSGIITHHERVIDVYVPPSRQLLNDTACHTWYPGDTVKLVHEYLY